MESPIVFLMAIGLATSLALAGGVYLGYRLTARRIDQSVMELSSLNDLGRQLLRSQLSVDDLCELIYWQSGQIVPASLFQLGLFDGDTYHVKVWVRDSERLPETAFPESANKGIIGWVKQTGQPLLVKDFEHERATLPAFPAFELTEPPKSGLFVPLIAGATTIGILAVQSRREGRFTEDHSRLLMALSNQVAWAIRNAQLYEFAQLRADRLNLISQVIAQISTVQPLPGLFAQIVSLVQKAFEYYCVTIFLYKNEKLTLAASTSPLLAEQIGNVDPGVGLIGWVAQEVRPALANDVAKDPRYRKIDALPETKSEIALPLELEGQVVGVLDVQGDRLGAFSNEDQFWLETLAEQLALAIEQARSYQEEHELAQRLEALTQVSQAIVSILDLEELLDKVVDLISDVFGYERVHIFLNIGHALVFRAGVGPHSVRWLVDELSYDLTDKGLITRAVREREAILVDDVTKNTDYRPGEGVEDTVSELVVPIVMANRVMGVIDLQSDQSGAFSQDDLNLMQSLADALAVALRNAALYVNERRRSELAETLREIGATLVSDLDLDNVLTGILAGLQRVMTLESAAIFLRDADATSIAIVAVAGDALADAVGSEYEIDLSLRPNDDDLLLEVNSLFQTIIGLETQPQAFITVPLLNEEVLIGFLTVNHSDVDTVSKHDHRIIEAFASQAAVAISNARLFESRRREAWVTTALLQVAEAVNAQFDVHEALRTIARLTSMLVGVEQCLILGWDNDLRTFRVEAGTGFASRVIEKLETTDVIASDYPYLDLLSVADRPIGAGRDYQLSIPEPFAAVFQDQSILGLPLRAKQELVGLLLVSDGPGNQPLDNRLTNILAGIANQAAMALETAVLYRSATERERLEQELEVAHQIQSSFIPLETPDLDGWQIAATWRAARQVSGDFYDFIPLPSGKWGVVIADVADKGVPAALFMAVCRTLIRAVAITRENPAETLIRVNEILHNDTRSDLFVTVLYGVWDPITGEFCYATGGHNPGLVVKPDGTIMLVHTRGIALGILQHITIDEDVVHLDPGDVLVAYTDGVTEAMQEDFTEWGLDNLTETVKKSRRASAEELLDDILSGIDIFVGEAPQSDDLTLCVIRRE